MTGKLEFIGFIERQQLAELLFTTRATLGGCRIAFMEGSLIYKELSKLMDDLQDLKERVNEGQQIRAFTQK
jgi:hypothetical protein